MWNDFHIKGYKFEIAWFALGEALFTCAIWFLAFFRLIPMARLPWQYCAAYYVFFIPIYVTNLIMSRSESKLLFYIAAWLNTFLWVVTILVFLMLIYGFLGCWSGSLPIECRDTQIWDGVVFIVTIPLLWITTRLFIIYWNAMAIIKNAETRRKRIPILAKHRDTPRTRLETAYKSRIYSK